MGSGEGSGVAAVMSTQPAAGADPNVAEESAIGRVSVFFASGADQIFFIIHGRARQGFTVFILIIFFRKEKAGRSLEFGERTDFFARLSALSLQFGKTEPRRAGENLITTSRMRCPARCEVLVRAGSATGRHVCRREDPASGCYSVHTISQGPRRCSFEHAMVSMCVRMGMHHCECTSVCV